MEKVGPFGFVFDLDTTIYKNNTIDEDAINLLKNALKTREKTPVMFISKFNLKETEKIITEIEKRVGKNKMKIITASNNGAYITNGKVGVKNSFSRKEINSIRNRVEIYAPGSIIVYKTKDHNYREQLTQAKRFRTKIRKGITLLFNPILKKYKKLNIFTKPFSEKMLNSFANNEQILSIEIIVPKKKVNFLNKKLSYVSNISTSIDKSINIANVSKWEAIQEVFKDKTNNIVYFGTNFTDKDCMLKCKNVICPNVKSKKMVKDIMFLQKERKQNIFSINGFNHKDLLSFLNNKKGSITRLKFDTKCVYDTLNKKTSFFSNFYPNNFC